MEQTEHYYGVVLSIRPTGALTFRRMPSSIVHISTYPFIPPSTLSGWLRRLYMLQRGDYPATRLKEPDYYVMPADYHVLGAYPAPEPQCSFTIHQTMRQGIKSFNHAAFSQLSRIHKDKENYQLHTWEYLMADRLLGYVLHRDAAVLEHIAELVNLGCKCGKEGYAFLEAVSDVQLFRRAASRASPSAPATGRELIGKPADLFVCYRHEYSQRQSLESDPASDAPSQIDGFTTIWLGWPARGIELDCFTDGMHVVPAGMLEDF